VKICSLRPIALAACALFITAPALADEQVKPAARIVQPGTEAAAGEEKLPEPLKSQADRDYRAFVEAAEMDFQRPYIEMSPRERSIFFEEHFMNLRSKALVFLAAHPQDPRRWNVAMHLHPSAPRFVLEWGPDGEDGEPGAVIDETAAAFWKVRIERLHADMRVAEDLPEDVRKTLAVHAERERMEQAFNDRWQSGREMAPDFTAYDMAGEAVRISDYRGNVVILDFWASWCGPCKAAMPHVQQLATDYADQGVVVLASGTNDEREDFEKFVTEHKEKYPDIIWMHDMAERGNERASKALYGVIGIPTQFVIDPGGKVVEVVVGYSEGDVRLDAALARAGVRVDPEVLAKAETDRKKQGL
jgi:thiol-disulfide isomerase/thioredoxin